MGTKRSTSTDVEFAAREMVVRRLHLASIGLSLSFVLLTINSLVPKLWHRPDEVDQHWRLIKLVEVDGAGQIFFPEDDLL